MQTETMKAKERRFFETLERSGIYELFYRALLKDYGPTGREWHEWFMSRNRSQIEEFLTEHPRFAVIGDGDCGVCKGVHEFLNVFARAFVVYGFKVRVMSMRGLVRALEDGQCDEFFAAHDIDMLFIERFSAKTNGCPYTPHQLDFVDDLLRYRKHRDCSTFLSSTLPVERWAEWHGEESVSRLKRDFEVIQFLGEGK